MSWIARLFRRNALEKELDREMQFHLDAAVVDLQLRQGSGFGVLRALRQLSPQPLTIVLTNSSMRAVRDRCLALGAHFFFDKSNEFDRVGQALDTRPPPPAPER